jgi:RND family efflux transporter MFP subunit
MDHEPMRLILRSIRNLTDSENGVPEADEHLLERFVARRDAAAFELLLWRHGPMVLGVCRRLLSNPQDAADAFQATFLTLVKKAGSVAKRSALASWLYQVAYRIALRVRITLGHRAQRERPGVEDLATPVHTEACDPELHRVLDEEVSRLPRRHRDAFILCCLEGKTGAEAARILGCPPGTVSSRLTRARERLRRRLLRRGIAPGVVVAPLLEGDGAAVAMPVPLIHSTLHAAVAFAAGQPTGDVLSAQAVTLAKGALRTMNLSQLKVVALWMLVVCAFAGGAIWSLQALDAGPTVQEKREPQTERGQLEKLQKGLPVVQVAKPQHREMEGRTEQQCSVQAYEEARIIPLVSGYVKRMAVHLGAKVRKGELLAEIEAPQLLLEEKQTATAVRQVMGQMREGDARVAIARAELSVAEKAVATKAAEVSSAKATSQVSQAELNRLTKARRTAGAAVSISDSELAVAESQADAMRRRVETAQAAMAETQAEVDVKKGKLILAEAARESLKANLEMAELVREKAQFALAGTRVVSPMDGVVTSCDAYAGDYARSDASGAPSTLLRVQRTDRVRVVVLIPERDALRTETEAPVVVRIDAFPGVEFRGKVSRIAFALDSKNHVMRAEIDLPNPMQRLRPGLTGQVSIELVKTRVLRIPASAIVAAKWFKGGKVGFASSQESIGIPRKSAVYIVRGGKAVRTEVVFLPFVQGEVDVFSGVGPNDLVVTDPLGLSGESVAVEVEGKK